MVRKTLAAAGLLLALFHGWLLIDQVWTGELSDLTLLARWLVAGGLAWGLWELRRQGAPLFVGRKAVALWLLAALLHGPAVVERFTAPGAPALPEVVATVAKVAAAAAAVVGILVLVGLLAPSRRRTHIPSSLVRSDHALLGALLPDAYFRFAPRPPPLA